MFILNKQKYILSVFRVYSTYYKIRRLQHSRNNLIYVLQFSKQLAHTYKIVQKKNQILNNYNFLTINTSKNFDELISNSRR